MAQFLGQLEGQRNPLAEALRGATEGAQIYQQGAQQAQQQEMQERELELEEQQTGMQQEQMDRQRAETIRQTAENVAGSEQFREFEKRLLQDPDAKELLDTYYPGMITRTEDGQSLQVPGGTETVRETPSFIVTRDKYGETSAVAMPDEAISDDPTRYERFHNPQTGELTVFDTVENEVVYDDVVGSDEIVMDYQMRVQDNGSAEMVPVNKKGEVMEDKAIKSVNPEMRSVYLDNQVRERELEHREQIDTARLEIAKDEFGLKEDQAEEAVRQFDERMDLQQYEIENQIAQRAEELGLRKEELREQLEISREKLQQSDEQMEQEWEKFNKQHDLQKEQWQDELTYKYDQLDQRDKEFMKEFGLNEEELRLMEERTQEELDHMWQKFGEEKDQAASQIALEESRVQNEKRSIEIEAERVGLQRDQLMREATQLRNFRLDMNPETNAIEGATADRWNPETKEWEPVDVGNNYTSDQIASILQYRQLSMQEAEMDLARGGLDDASSLATATETRILKQREDATQPVDDPMMWRESINHNVNSAIRGSETLGPDDRDRLTGEVVAELQARGDFDYKGDREVDPRQFLNDNNYDHYKQRLEELGAETPGDDDDKGGNGDNGDNGDEDQGQRPDETGAEYRLRTLGRNLQGINQFGTDEEGEPIEQPMSTWLSQMLSPVGERAEMVGGAAKEGAEENEIQQMWQDILSEIQTGTETASTPALLEEAIGGNRLERFLSTREEEPVQPSLPAILGQMLMDRIAPEWSPEEVENQE